jgi:hypothetical protein
MDVLALLSREYPFALVMLEAPAQGLPVVCFANSGEGPAFLGDDTELRAAFLDAVEFATHFCATTLALRHPRR